MTVPVSHRLSSLPSYVFAALGARINDLRAPGQGCLLRLDIGSPDLPPDPAIIAALADAGLSADRPRARRRAVPCHRFARPLHLAAPPPRPPGPWAVVVETRDSASRERRQPV
jgi:hypothetical protein